MRRRLVILAALVLLFTFGASAETGEKTVYGYSGEGRELVAWRYGDGEHVLVMCFAIHGFEDKWDRDSHALVYSAEKLRAYLETSNLPDLHNWTVYVLPCLNPDGLYSGWTNNGPGRCTTTYFDESGRLVSGRGIDMNRCFPAMFRQLDSSRNFNGSSPMACREARALAEFLTGVKGGKTNVLVDVHGWLEQTITTSPRLLTAVQSQFPDNRITEYNGGNGYLIRYAYTMGYESCLLELPAHFESLDQYTASDCTQRIIQTVAAVLKSEKTPCSVEGHKYQIHEQIPTCTAGGYEKQVCRICGLTQQQNFAALGHSPVESSLEILRQETACRPGSERFDCSRCGKTGLTRQIPPVFRDTEEDRYYSDPLDACYGSGYIQGVTADTFCPDSPLSRAMLVTVLYRYAGKPAAAADTPFGDIEENAYYVPALKWAYEKGIIQGVTATEFAPHSPVTRQQAAVIFHRFAQISGMDNGLREHTPFADEERISAYALDAAHWAAANGILIGDEAGRLDPQGTATRAQSVTVLMRLDGYFENWNQEEQP